MNKNTVYIVYNLILIAYTLWRYYTMSSKNVVYVRPKRQTRKVSAFQSVTNITTTASGNTLFTATDSGQTIYRIVGNISLSQKVAANQTHLAILHLPPGVGISEISHTATATDQTGNTLWFGQVSLPSVNDYKVFEVDVKSQRKMKIGDVLMLVWVSDNVTGASVACRLDLFIKEP